MHCARSSPAVTIKQEPLADAEVQAPVFHASWIDDEQFASDALLWPFVNLVDDETMDDVWSARPQDDAREDSWVSLLCHEDASVHDAGITSPVATSDVVHFPQPALDKPVSPRWTAARLDDTMGSSIAAEELEKTCTSHGCYQRVVNEETGRCARHAGGRLCKVAGCTKNTQSHGLCIRHGGGRRCQVEGCPRGAQARGKCKTHGGGVRCKAPDCWRSSQGSGLCRTHGGGKLCDYPGCKKGTQRHGKCSTHGIVRRCQVAGCDKMDRGGGLCRRHMTEAKASDAGSESSAEDTDAAAGI